MKVGLPLYMDPSTPLVSGECLLSIKPMFHQNKNALAIGPLFGVDPERISLEPQSFSLNPKHVHLPTCWYQKSLVDPTQTIMDPTQDLT